MLDFCDAFLENEVQRVLRAYPDTITIDIHCAQLGHWSSLPDKNFTKACKIRINPVDVLDSGNEKLNAFTGEWKLMRDCDILRVETLGRFGEILYLDFHNNFMSE